MSETQRRPVPRTVGSELRIALDFLGFARESVLKKLDDLSDADVRRALVPTGTNLLGLVQHLTASERYWFGHHVAGQPLPTDFDDEEFFSMTVDPARSRAEVVTAYREAAAASDELAEEIEDLDVPVAVAVGGLPLTLGWVFAHMTTETARHAGHADILRELIDGTTGR